MVNVIMRGRDTIAAQMAKCYFVISGTRYNFGNMKDCEFKVDKNKTQVKRLGAIMDAHKAISMEGTFSGTMYYNRSELRMALKTYQDTGEDLYFEAEITNDDPTSAAGSQTAIFYDCNLDGGTLAKFDVDGDVLDEDVSGTFDAFSIPKTFTALEGFGG